MSLFRAPFAILSCAAAFAFGCSSDQSVTGGRSDAGAGAAPSRESGAGTGASTGSGGSSNGPVTCESSSLSVAPDQCVDIDWAHTVHDYPRTCGVTLGKYQASCGAFDTAIDIELATETWCFYSHDTGQLIASRQTAHGATTCLTFDIDVTVPDVNTCTPVSGAACLDAGL